VATKKGYLTLFSLLTVFIYREYRNRWRDQNPKDLLHQNPDESNFFNPKINLPDGWEKWGAFISLSLIGLGINYEAYNKENDFPSYYKIGFVVAYLISASFIHT